MLHLVSLERSISFLRIEGNVIDQAECFENTRPLPQRAKYSHFAKASGLKNRLKAERAWFLSRMERRAKPETEHLLPRWGKSSVFLNPLARASFKRFSQSPSLIFFPPSGFRNTSNLEREEI